MKIRVTKLYLRLSAIILAGLSFTHAYIFDVNNRDPFGTLNLSKLIIKPDTTKTGIILDGETYTIKIDPNHEKNNGGQIRVYEICDESGQNCNQVSTLGSGGAGGGISADGTTGEYCYLNDNGNLTCSTNNLNPTIIELIRLFGIQVTTGANTGYYCSSTDGHTIECNNSVDNLTFSGGIIMSGNDNYICVASGNDNNSLKCTQIKLGNEFVNNKYCQYTESGIVCNADSVSDGSGIIAFGTGGEICYLNEDGKSLICDNGVLGVLSGTIAQLVAMFRATIDNNNNNSGYLIPVTVSATGSNTGYYCSSTDGNTLECNNPIDGLTFSGGGIVMSGNDNYICVASGNDNNSLKCTQVKLGNVFENGKYCQYTESGIVCNADSVSEGNSIAITGSKLKRCRYRDIIIVTGDNGEIYEIEAPIDYEWLVERMASSDNPYRVNIRNKYQVSAMQYLQGTYTGALKGKIECIYDNTSSGGNGITIIGSGGNICYLTGDDTLECSNTILGELSGTIAQLVIFFRKTIENEIAGIKFPVAVNNTGANTGYYCSSTGSGDMLECNNPIPLNISITTGANTGYYCSSTDGNTLECNNPIDGLTFSGGGIVMSGNDNYICVASGNDNNSLKCTQIKLGNDFVQNKYCQYTESGIVCNANAVSDGSGIIALGTGGEICYLYTEGELSGNLMCDNSVLGVLSGTIAQLVAMFWKTQSSNPNPDPEYEAPAIINTTGANTGYYCSSTDGNTLECNNEVILGDSIAITGSNSKRCKYMCTGIPNPDEITTIECDMFNENTTSFNACQTIQVYWGKSNCETNPTTDACNSLKQNYIELLEQLINCHIECNEDAPTSSGGIVALGTGGEICYLYTEGESSGNLMCDNSVLGVLSGTIAQLVAMFWKTQSSNPNPDPEYEAPAIINTTGANTGYYCSSTDGNTLECDNEVILGDAILTGELGKRCRYGAIVNGSAINWTPDALQGSQQMIQTGIICMNDEPGGWTINSENDTIYTKNSMPIAIGTDTSGGYTLNVNGSGRIETRFNIGDNLGILNSETREVYVPIESCPPTPTYITGPTVRYNGTLAFKNDGFSCNNGYIEFGGNGKVGIGGPTETSTKLSIYGHTKIYSTQSAEDQYIELFNEIDYSKGRNVSNVISKWSDMRIGLTGDQNIIGIQLPSAYIYINKTSIGINKEPEASSRDPSSPLSGNYMPPLQINGGIQLSRPSSNAPISNMEVKYLCNESREGTIEYYSGNFYGCVIYNDGSYGRRTFTTESFGNDLPSAPVSGNIVHS